MLTNNVRPLLSKLMSSDGTMSDYTYTAYGESTSENASLYNPLGYTGEYQDLCSGLIYLRNRYYDPSIGRFITEDPARDGFNWYVYCGNNPVMFVDPSGEIPVIVITVIGGSIIGAIVSGGANIIAQGVSKGWDNISWGEVGINTLSGAASGALSGSGVGLGWVVAGNAAISAGTYAGTQAINNEGIKMSEILVNAGFGATFGLFGGSSADTIQDLTNTQTAYYMAKALGLQSGQEINKKAFTEIAMKAGGVSLLHGIRDEIIEELGSTIIGIGSTGESVRYLQSILGVEQDGIFGIQTQTALKELQKKLGVVDDGIYGAQTKNALSTLFE